MKKIKNTLYGGLVILAIMLIINLTNLVFAPLKWLQTTPITPLVFLKHLGIMAILSTCTLFLFSALHQFVNRTSNTPFKATEKEYAYNTGLIAFFVTSAILLVANLYGCEVFKSWTIGIGVLDIAIVVIVYLAPAVLQWAANSGGTAGKKLTKSTEKDSPEPASKPATGSGASTDSDTASFPGWAAVFIAILVIVGVILGSRSPKVPTKPLNPVNEPVVNTIPVAPQPSSTSQNGQQPLKIDYTVPGSTNQNDVGIVGY